MSYRRKINLLDLLQKKSHFLFGPRATGKTFAISQQLKGRATVVNLLKSDLYLRLSGRPAELRAIVAESAHNVIVIDEIQKVPLLLDEVHNLIEENKELRFLLTGSSARRLKRENANMLGGRAWRAEMFPLCYGELDRFELDRYLRYGGLPTVYDSSSPEEELDAYVTNYLKEEIQAEGWVRKLPQFSRFLRTAALSNSRIINFEKVGSDAQISPSTVREYFYLLSDTLIGQFLEPWIDSKKRKAVSTAKFYFFDTGVTHAIAGTKQLDRNSNLYGESFEQWLGMELRAWLSYTRRKEPLGFWRTSNGDEVDFTIGDRVGIEVKATQRTTDKDAKGLKRLAEEGVFESFYLVSQDETNRMKDGIHFIHYETFLQKLWSDEL